MKRAGIVALIAMGVISGMFIEQAGATARVEETSNATLSPVTTIDAIVVLVTVLVGVLTRPRPRKSGLTTASSLSATPRWPVRISVDRDPRSKFLIPS
ncbi:MAG TPA: hypothetical protein VKE96_16550 [Vicinamibacterales bacterium]|nr:hypothetical protein [Vicinamibacterales bacterium]